MFMLFFSIVTFKGAFTPDANASLRANDLHQCQCKDAIDNPTALFARTRRHKLRELHGANYGKPNGSEFVLVFTAV